MKVLVTGGKGQLGHDLVKVFLPSHQVYALGRDDMDICDRKVVSAIVHELRPDVVIHAAAYTSVDDAEARVDEAFRVNAFGTRNVVAATEEIGARFCYISTDYVFDGKLERPYREYDKVSPANVYGQSKLAGEVITQTLSTRYFIVRTSWVFGDSGNNFVKTMLRLGQERGSLTVVNDQRGGPTYTVDLATFIEKLVDTQKYGIYHVSNSGSCTWFEFAQAIFEEAGISVDLSPCSTAEFTRPAQRPHNSVFEHLSLRTNGFTELPHWRDALL